MRITISIPGRLFAAAEQAARQMGISRSELYALAIERFIAKQDDDIRRDLNRVYKNPANRILDPLIRAAASYSLTDENW